MPRGARDPAIRRGGAAGDAGGRDTTAPAGGMVGHLDADLRRAVQGILSVQAITVVDVPALDIPEPVGGLDVTEAPPPAGQWQEADVRAGIAWLCNQLADLTGAEADRAADWELDLTVPGVTRMLNQWAPGAGGWLADWRPGGEMAWPDWAGILLMALKRTAPRALAARFEGPAVTWLMTAAGYQSPATLSPVGAPGS